MKIVHVVDDLSAANTGITSAVRELSRATLAAGHGVEVVSVGPAPDWGMQGLLPRTAPVEGIGPAVMWRYAPRFDEVLRGAANDNAVVHLHGLWFYPQWHAARVALRRRWPLVVSPHNMLGGWLWQRGKLRRLKKAMYFSALLRGPLGRAQVVHALSEDESARIAKFLPGVPRMTIPNALDLRAAAAELTAAGPVATGDDRYILFLGRIHPVKGLDVLIDAVARAQGARLIIAGPAEDAQCDAQIRKRVREARLQKRVTFIGPVRGADKWSLIAAAWVVCAPSHSEGISMVALESMAAKVPIITTPAAGFTEMDSAGGMLVEIDSAQIAAALSAALAWTPEERARRGALARAAVEQKYSWPKVWPLYEKMYRSALAAGKT